MLMRLALDVFRQVYKLLANFLMGREAKLPFEVGQQVEAKTFEEGFRGAWFNCRIRGITKKKGGPQYLLEYYDFPDEKWAWTYLYQVPPYDVGREKGKHRELILRPSYPPTYNEREMPHVSEISEVTVIVRNSWKIGDMVDWSDSDCNWSGKITQLLGDNRAKIELHPQPFGEGSDYVAELKDVRPSLDWSPEHGWTIPTQEGDSGPPCAWLIKPKNQVTQETHNTAEEADPIRGSAGSSASCPVSSNSAVTDSHIESPGEASKQLQDGKENTATKCIKSWADDDSGPGEGIESCPALKKSRASNVCSNCLVQNLDTLEAAMMELEEYVNKVKWLKKILQYPLQSFDAEGPQWEIVDPKQIPK